MAENLRVQNFKTSKFPYFLNMTFSEYKINCWEETKPLVLHKHIKILPAYFNFKFNLEFNKLCIIFMEKLECS